ncbi:MAG: type IV pili methyl-accepting chemotaxis transducer N-terminal domain-containing protein [Pseudomonadota bacterium]
MPSPSGNTTRIEPNSPPALKRALTRRYVFALSLVFCILLATFTVFTRQTSIAENDAYLINISGMQRMLSQRIALMAKELRRSGTEAEADDFALKLEEAIDKMYANHVALSTGKLGRERSYELSPALQEKYFGTLALDERVRDYILSARTFLDMYQERGLDVIKAALLAEDNVAYKRRGLLKDLNATVAVYETEAKSRIKSFQQLELGFFILGLLILLGEVLFIFQPMVRMIVSKTRSLEASNSELLELSKKLLERHTASKTSR